MDLACDSVVSLVANAGSIRRSTVSKALFAIVFALLAVAPGIATTKSHGIATVVTPFVSTLDIAFWTVIIHITRALSRSIAAAVFAARVLVAVHVTFLAVVVWTIIAVAVPSRVVARLNAW